MGSCMSAFTKRPGTSRWLSPASPTTIPGRSWPSGSRWRRPRSKRTYSRTAEFRLVSYEPRDTLGNSWFRPIEFQHRHISEDPRDPSHYTAAIIFVNDDGEQLVPPTRTQKHGDFRDPVWYHLDDPAELVGCEVQTWPRGEYTVAALFGPEGEAVRATFAANTRSVGEQLRAYLEE